MHLTLYRSYFPSGTNGRLYVNGQFQCYTIELPWLHNATGRSCIPEGTYLLLKRWTPERGYHIMLANVPGRSLILIHPANYALRELQGCIAAVSALVQPGMGTRSRKAVLELNQLVLPAMQQAPIYLTIQKNTA